MPNPSGTAIRLLITAGPTREYIDPVRFISNPSTGAIGYALATAAATRGHRVVLVSGPTHLSPPAGVRFVAVESAVQMQRQVNRFFPWAQAVIAAAAVGDYRPRRPARTKIKKENTRLRLDLMRNPDILEGLGQRKGAKILIGFALESANMRANARAKLEKKNLDLIVANRCSRRQSPFGSGRTSAVIIGRHAETYCAAVSKMRLAGIILDRMERLCYSLPASVPIRAAGARGTKKQSRQYTADKALKRPHS
ncbi:MAG: phosphopantothenoylcysteine decarboxylase [Candidatus Omnitrophica bacterium]|nr:phosphopantothenoylcysteine decarboxylase [Candidatus Omnitrophota bacterium]